MTPSIEFTTCLALNEPQRAVTPDHSAVMFSGDVVLGGGRIAS
jgi:tRNA U34 2-thiouridine synthase MnmA/TrmU